ncbi:MAG: sigma-54-dependent Fis family transcriptional regulator [Bdellovibrionales bacterium]|nr:sigma-54-dependent Fis family transcriptional regulator [Bdellovibrionales bacterium]
MEKILIVEDTDSLREVLCTVLTCEGYAVTPASSAEEGLALFKDGEFTLVLSDLKLPDKNGLEFLKESKVLDNNVPVIVMTAYGSIDTAVQAMKLGATDFITKPFDPGMLCAMIEQVAKHRRIVDRTMRKRTRKLITQCPLMEQVLQTAQKVAPLSTPVLIIGESGTGKELVARFIHERSPRSQEEFVAVNCASMPGELLESEFFGHEAGSFTGATEQRLGLFEVADRGTIFLDEIGNMPHELQVKLLRTLQESEIKRVGSNEIRKVDTRVISATNCDIEEEIRKGGFRDDLYYRLGVMIIELPPLRERKGDIALLANFFVKSLAAEMNAPAKVLTPEAIRFLESHSWPGNVRELENVIERALIFSEDGPIAPESFELAACAEDAAGMQGMSLPEIAGIALRQAEIEAILQALQRTDGNKSKAAKELGVSYKTLLNKIKEYELRQ